MYDDPAFRNRFKQWLDSCEDIMIGKAVVIESKLLKHHFDLVTEWEERALKAESAYMSVCLENSTLKEAIKRKDSQIESMKRST